jgi:hypothetical protein
MYSIICAGDALIYLVRVLFPTNMRLSSISKGHTRESSAGLLENLELHLNPSDLPFIRAKASYNHSAFMHQKRVDMDDGVDHHETLLTTEVTASIKRNMKVDNNLADWIPKPDDSLLDTKVLNDRLRKLFLETLQSHFGLSMLERLLRRMDFESYPRGDIQMYEARSYYEQCNQSSETVIPQSNSISSFATAVSRFTSTDSTLSSYRNENSRSASDEMSPTSLRSYFAQNIDFEYDRKTDQAAKIWSEMRKISRGSRARPARLEQRKSSTSTWGGRPAGSWDAVQDSVQRDTKPPSTEQNLSLLSPVGTSDHDINNDEAEEMELEKGRQSKLQIEVERIRGEALRNKRSVGAETLRSLAGPDRRGAWWGGSWW